jgi:hypothetical protein
MKAIEKELDRLVQELCKKPQMPCLWGKESNSSTSYHRQSQQVA